MKPNPDPQIKSFPSSIKFREWLSKNYTRHEGIWLKLFRKDSGKQTFSRAEALDEALCFGWIDGQGKAGDDESWLVKFTPRREKSIWSKINRTHVERLIVEERMTEHGLKEIERAKTDGRWDVAYDSPKNMEVPEDFLIELKRDQKAYEFFKSLNKANTYAIAWRLQTAKKPETRAGRMEKLLGLMKRREKLH